MIKSKKDFINSSILIHFDNFDYSKFEYTGSKNKSILICNKCNIEFSTTPSNNLTGSGCKNCYEISRRELKNITERISKIYIGWEFDFSNYVNRDSVVKYKCDNNHSGENTPVNMMRYNVCNFCRSTETTNNKIKRIENNNIKVVNYLSDDEIICECIKCKYRIVNNYHNLIYKNYICSYCELTEQSSLVKEGIVKIIEIKGSYIRLECKNGHSYVQDRSNLLQNKKCNQCRIDNKSIKKENIIEMFRKIHGYHYEYNIENFKTLKSKIEISCEKNHTFYQQSSNHLQGKGCPICRESSGERIISKYLELNNIEFVRQMKYKDCIFKLVLPFDFYVPSINLLIEFDGIQHFKPVKLFGGVKEFEKIKIKDKIKTDYCLNNNIPLLRISYLENIEEKLLLINKLIVL